MNSAVITTEGVFRYQRLSVEEARNWMKQPFVSRVRYDATADAIGMLLGVRPHVDRTPLIMRARDQALIFRLTMSMSTFDKHNLTPGYIAHNAEIGLLTRLS